MRHIILLVIITMFMFPSALYASEVNQVVLIDGFDDFTTENALGGETQGDEESSGGCIPSFVEDEELIYNHFGSSLKLEYDVSEPSSFSFYWSRMNSEGKTRDFSEHNYISFWYMAEKKNNRFFLEVHKDVDGDGVFHLGKDVSSKVFIAKYAQKTTPGVWRKVTIPFSDFFGLKTWEHIFEIVFVFENAKRSGHGAVYIDDIVIGSNFPLEREMYESPFPGKMRVNLFTANNNKVDMRFVLHKENKFDLLLKNRSPILERIMIQVSEDGIQNWLPVCSFYDHSSETYQGEWVINKDKKTFYFMQVVASDLFGRERILDGPHGGTFLPEK